MWLPFLLAFPCFVTRSIAQNKDLKEKSRHFEFLGLGIQGFRANLKLPSCIGQKKYLHDKNVSLNATLNVFWCILKHLQLVDFSKNGPTFYGHDWLNTEKAASIVMATRESQISSRKKHVSLSLESQRYMTLTCIWKHSLLVELIFQKRSHVLRPWLTQHRKNCINRHGNPWVTNFIAQKKCFT